MNQLSRWQNWRAKVAKTHAGDRPRLATGRLHHRKSVAVELANVAIVVGRLHITLKRPKIHQEVVGDVVGVVRWFYLRGCRRSWLLH
jgi:hypothetical protein